MKVDFKDLKVIRGFSGDFSFFDIYFNNEKITGDLNINELNDLKQKGFVDID
jgi:hypothetical protein